METSCAFRELVPYLQTVMKNDGDDAYFDGYRAGSFHAWEKAGMEGEPPGWENEDEEAENNADPETDEGLKDVNARVLSVVGSVGDLLDRLEPSLAQDGYFVWSAYLAFCEEAMDLDGRKLLSAFAPEFTQKAGRYDGMAERLELEPAPEMAEEYGESMRTLWRKYMDRAA